MDAHYLVFTHMNTTAKPSSALGRPKAAKADFYDM